MVLPCVLTMGALCLMGGSLFMGILQPPVASEDGISREKVTPSSEGQVSVLGRAGKGAGTRRGAEPRGWPSAEAPRPNPGSDTAITICRGLLVADFTLLWCVQCLQQYSLGQTWVLAFRRP